MDLELCRKFFAEKQYSTIYVGFSGGADSTAALLVALYFSRIYSFSVTAVHFDHHLRGAESDADARYCQYFAERRGVPFVKIDLDLPVCSSIENAARQARLRHWKSLTGKKTDCAVVLGHHGDDRRENFFLRMLRGANLSGLLSPKSRTVIDGIEIIRPLLSFSRKEIEEFLLKQNVSDWRIDSTNLVPDCSRNRLRLEILPALYDIHSGAYSGVNQCLDVLEQDAEFIEKEAGKVFDSDRICTREYWKNLHPAVAARVIRLWKKQIPSADFLCRFREELQRPAPTEVRKIAWNDSDFLCFRQERVEWQTKNTSPVCEEASWIWNDGSCQFGQWKFEAVFADSFDVCSRFEAVFDADLLEKKLILSLPCPGDTMTLFGSGKKQKIKKLRVDAKIPACWQLPVLKTAAGKIVWAPGVRHSDMFSVTENTRKIIRFRAGSAQLGIGFRID